MAMAASGAECQHAVFIGNYLALAASSRGEQEREAKMTPSETELMLKGYGLTTAEFFYHMPDYAHVLNSFTWQEYDLAPDHPKLFEFVEFWQQEIEGPLHSVRFCHRRLIGPGEWQHQVGEFTLH
jgi:uncharacterized protein Usg